MNKPVIGDLVCCVRAGADDLRRAPMFTMHIFIGETVDRYVLFAPSNNFGSIRRPFKLAFKLQRH